MEITKNRLKQIIKEEIAKANLSEITQHPEGYNDDTHEFHDPASPWRSRSADIDRQSPEGPRHPDPTSSASDEITIVGMDADGDMFARKTPLEDIIGMTSVKQVQEYIEDKMKTPVRLTNKTVNEIAALIGQDDTASSY